MDYIQQFIKELAKDTLAPNLTISEIIEGCQKLNLNRTLNPKLTDMLGYEVSARGIREKFSCSYKDWSMNGGQESWKTLSHGERKSVYNTLIDRLIARGDVTDLFASAAWSEALLNDSGSDEEKEEKPPLETPPLEAEYKKPTPQTQTQPVPQQEEYTPESAEMMLSFQLPFQQMMYKAFEKNRHVLDVEIRNLLAEAVKELQPNFITIGERKPVEVKGQLHQQFDKALKILNVQQSLFISGPTGSGKTHLAKQLADALDLKFYSLSCTAGMSEAHLTGRMLADGSYVSTGLVEAYENGGVMLFDEVDASDPNTLLIINSAIANGIMSIPNRRSNPVAKRHKDFYVICAANTWGDGSFEYSGREVLDAAFMNRFSVSKVSVDYDTKLEAKLTGEDPLTEKLQKVRNIKGLERNVSTRTIIDSYKLKLSGMPRTEVLKTLTEGWTYEEVKKVQEATGDTW